MVLADSGRIARVPPYLGYPLGSIRDFGYGALTLYGPVFQPARLSSPQSYIAAPLPQHSFLWWFGLFRFRSPLLAESSFLSFPPGTEMFHFPGFARTCLSFQHAVMQHYLHWVSPFGYLRIIAWLAAPRSFSQLPASFFASDCLGIHRVPFLAWSLVSSQLPTYAKTKVQLGG